MQKLERSKVKQNILDVLKNSEQIVFDFKQKVGNKHVVIFVGNTRSGKSTLVNYIAGVPLAGVKRDDTFKIDTVGRSTIVVQHGTLSCTTIPTVIELPQYPNTLIVDAPGFDDNRGALQEVFNALYINQIKHAKSVKFVLVSDIIDIVTDNINNFLSFIETVRSIVPDVEKLQNACSIIFTKVSQDYDRANIIELLKLKFLSTNKLYCRTDVIKHFVEHPGVIGLFKMPHEVGQITYDLSDNIEGAIFGSEQINISKEDIKFGISKEAKVVLLSAYLDFFDVRISMKDLFTDFSKSTMCKLNSLEKEKLLLLSEHHLMGPNNVLDIMDQYCTEVSNKLQELSVLFDIPVIFHKLFVVGAAHTFTALLHIGIELNNAICEMPLDDINRINEVQRHLEYLIGIEKVVEMNSQSKSIIDEFKKCTDLFYKSIERCCNNIQTEIKVRKYLRNTIKKIADILPVLDEIDELYLQDSRKVELVAMKNEVTYYIEYFDNIVQMLKSRPLFYSDLRSDIQKIPLVVARINQKIVQIDQNINSRSDNYILSVAGSMLLPILGGFYHYTSIKYAATFVGLVLLCCSLKRGRKMIVYLKRRWSQNRMLRNATVLDGYCHKLQADIP